jgi:hypothetical protein
VAALSSEELLDEGRRVIWILFREKVSAFQAGHPGPTEATLGIRFACRLPYRRYRVRRRSLFSSTSTDGSTLPNWNPWTQASRGRYVADLIVAVDPAITPPEAGMRDLRSELINEGRDVF